MLYRAQEALAPSLPLTGVTKIWKERQTYIKHTGIATSVALKGPVDAVTDMENALNVQLLETVLSTFPAESNGDASHVDVVRLACQCLWVSELLALVVSGIADVSEVKDGTYAVVPLSDEKRQHLRRLWFGSAFEQASLTAASFTIQNLAAIAADPLRRDQLSDAKVSALTVFPQHWRLPPDTGPVLELLFESLEPLLLMIIYTIYASRNPAMPPFGSQQAAAKEIEEVYEFVREVQKRLPVVDRLFDVVPDGLVLGTRELAPAAIETAERLAERALGIGWHGSVTSDAQKAHLFEQLGHCKHIEILDFELLQHHTTNNVSLDVDFFLRDNAHGQIYGVQLKHLQRRTRGGVLAWLSLFRENDDGLGNLVRQLENLSELARTDKKCRAFLMSQGFSAFECDRIVPVGLHNIGFVDFWIVQNSVLLYDMNTFANVLKGRSGVAVVTADGRVVHQRLAPAKDPVPSPHDPDSVIAAYLSDPRYQHLVNFDLAADVCRTANIGHTSVVMHGLGI